MQSKLQIEPETAETEGKRRLHEAQERYREEQNLNSAGSQADRPVMLELPATSPASPFGFWKIAFAVFAGNLMTGIVAAILYAIAH